MFQWSTANLLFGLVYVVAHQSSPQCRSCWWGRNQHGHLSLYPDQEKIAQISLNASLFYCDFLSWKVQVTLPRESQLLQGWATRPNSIFVSIFLGGDKLGMWPLSIPQPHSVFKGSPSMCCVFMRPHILWPKQRSWNRTISPDLWSRDVELDVHTAAIPSLVKLPVHRHRSEVGVLDIVGPANTPTQSCHGRNTPSLSQQTEVRLFKLKLDSSNWGQALHTEAKLFKRKLDSSNWSQTVQTEVRPFNLRSDSLNESLTSHWGKTLQPEVRLFKLKSDSSN